MTDVPGVHPDDDLAAYAIGGLDADQYDAVASHLERCARCRAQLDTYLETLAALGSDEEPPPHIWDRISAQITTSHHPASPRTTGPGEQHAGSATRRRHLRSARRRRVAAAVLGAAAVVVIVVAVGVAQFRSDPEPDTPDELAQAALDDPDSTVVPLADPDDGTPAARLVIDATGDDAYVLLDNLTTLPDDQTYQLWRTEGTTPVSLGVLGTGSPNAVQITLPAGTARLAISQEPAGGSPTPTGPLVAAGTPN